MLTFKTFRKVTNGFARGHHFNIGIIDWRDKLTTSNIAGRIVGTATTPLFNAFCASTHLPTKTIEAHELRVCSGVTPIKIAKNVTYNNWKVTFYADEILGLRYFFLRWMELINDTANHSYTVPCKYKSTMAYAAILSPQNIPVHVYTFRGLYPVNVSEVVMQQRDTDIMTFDVEFTYDFFTLNDPLTFAVAFSQEVIADEILGGLATGGLKGAVKGLKTGIKNTIKGVTGTIKGLNPFQKKKEGKDSNSKKLNAPMGVSIKVPF